SIAQYGWCHPVYHSVDVVSMAKSGHKPPKNHCNTGTLCKRLESVAIKYVQWSPLDNLRHKPRSVECGGTKPTISRPYFCVEEQMTTSHPVLIHHRLGRRVAFALEA